MSEKILDLNKLPFGFGPLKTYDKYLLWKLGSMRFGEILHLPIFSAFTVLRFSEGFILENEVTKQLWAVESHNYGQLLEFLETQSVQKMNRNELSLSRYFLAARLWQAGKSNTEIARLLKTSRGRATAYIECGRLDLAAFTM